MNQVRCVIANMPQKKMLREIIEKTLGQGEDVEIVDSVDDLEIDNLDQIKSVLNSHAIDLVVLDMQASEIPWRYSQIMDAIPNLAVIGIVGDGRRLAAYVDNGGTDELKCLIQALFRQPEGSPEEQPV
jgi:hypothetical protein